MGLKKILKELEIDRKSLDKTIKRYIELAHEEKIIKLELDDGVESTYIREQLKKIIDGEKWDRLEIVGDNPNCFYLKMLTFKDLKIGDGFHFLDLNGKDFPKSYLHIKTGNFTSIYYNNNINHLEWGSCHINDNNKNSLVRKVDEITLPSNNSSFKGKSQDVKDFELIKAIIAENLKEIGPENTSTENHMRKSIVKAAVDAIPTLFL